MAVLDISLILVFIVGVSSGSDSLVPSSPCSLEYARYLPIYDLNVTTLNVMRRDDILESIQENGFYQFDDVEKKTLGGMFYGNYPVLAVYQPEENIPELHGFHYPSPWGLQIIYDTDSFSAEDYAIYEDFRDFLNSPLDKEGFTPSAALHIYPQLKEYKLTKVVENAHKLNLRDCAVLFILPKKDDLKDDKFAESFNLFEEFYYNTSEICKPSGYRNLEADDIEDVTHTHVPLWTVFDHWNFGDDDGYNVLDFDQINEHFSYNGYHRFENLSNTFTQAFMSYSDNPTLIVLQPDEKVPELHGYYFHGGVRSLASYLPDDEESVNAYAPFFEYLLKETDLDGFTPDAVRYNYPYFFDYKLMRFIHDETVAELFAILFLAPSRYRPTNFYEKYYALVDYRISNNDIIAYS